jgi:hypothetical protein
MSYIPTPLDALQLYHVAAAWNPRPSDGAGLPSPLKVKQSSAHVFHILTTTASDLVERQRATIAICIYDLISRQWYVRLQDRLILKVARDDERGEWVVIEVLPEIGNKTT